jgi:S1-C subfamily serine protease
MPMRDTFLRVLATVFLSASIWFGAQSCSYASSMDGNFGDQSAATAPLAQIAPTPQQSSTQSPPSSEPPSIEEFSGAIRWVAEQVKPAVVQITTQELSEDIFIESESGVGSGVIYDPAGYILTNNHVVAGAQTLTVALPDGRTFEGTLLGGDPQTDLAVVQIHGDDLPVAKLGDSDQLNVGDWVVAIGNALGLPGGPTVTVGVVSALGRTVQEPGDALEEGGPFLYDLIQTDAYINPGNSGGALVNLKGEVVGINTLVAGAAGSGILAQGIGFAIAVNRAQPIAEQLTTTGRVVHPFLGIRYVGITPAIAQELGIQDIRGIIVMRVVPGSPAEQAGVQQFDIIESINGQGIEHESTLGRVLSNHKPGDAVSLEVQREGIKQVLEIILGERPPE